MTGYRDPGVARERKKAHVLRLRIQSHQYDRVRAPRVTLLAGIGAKQQDVQGFVQVGLGLKGNRGHNPLRGRRMIDGTGLRRVRGVTRDERVCRHSA